MKTQVTIIGFGIMGQAIAGAISKNDKQIKVIPVDKNNSKLPLKIKDMEKSDFIILSIKPQDAEKAILEIKNHLKSKTILVSIMAGVPIKKLVSLSGHQKIVRMMPNLGLAIGEGIAVWKTNNLSKEEIKKTKSFLNKITENFEVANEDTINKVMTISGCGPAYFFLLANSLIKACADLNLNEKESQQLVIKTFSAAALLAKKGDYFELIKKVASQGGATEAALQIFEKENFDKIVLKAVKAAYKRAQELGK